MVGSRGHKKRVVALQAGFDGLSKVCDKDCSHAPNEKHAQKQQQRQPTKVDAVNILWGEVGGEGRGLVEAGVR